MDKYQKRYLEHQTKKALTLKEIISKRHSDRQFGDGELTLEEIARLKDAIEKVPSSCNRNGIAYHIVSSRTQKAFLSGVLVGGVGWVHRASEIFLLYADMDAYKENLDYMHYLDTGVIVQQLYLVATELDIAVCFVNPNIRDEHKDFFYDYFKVPENLTFTGAMAFGRKEK